MVDVAQLHTSTIRWLALESNRVDDTNHPKAGTSSIEERASATAAMQHAGMVHDIDFRDVIHHRAVHLPGAMRPHRDHATNAEAGEDGRATQRHSVGHRVPH